MLRCCFQDIVVAYREAGRHDHASHTTIKQVRAAVSNVFLQKQREHLQDTFCAHAGDGNLASKDCWSLYQLQWGETGMNMLTDAGFAPAQYTVLSMHGVMTWEDAALTVYC